MNLQEKINENTTLFYIEANNWHCDDNNNVVIDAYELSFGFYDCYYMVYVTPKDLKRDWVSVQMEGDSKLFESFEYAVEYELWELIKAKCKAFDKWQVVKNKLK